MAPNAPRDPRRHPSAGNLSARPTLVAPPATVASLPPVSFPNGAATAEKAGVRLGPDLDHDALTKLLGPLEGRRILELGCGSGSAGVALASAGARVTSVDPSLERLARARAAAEAADVRIEWHHSDPAELAFVRADSIDAVLAAYSLSEVADLARVFRQLHRVLAQDAPLVLSLPHPMAAMLDWDPEEQASPWLARTFWSEEPIGWHTEVDQGTTHVHQVSSVFTALHRCNFRVDTIAEPRAVPAVVPSPWAGPLDEWVPPTLVVRARKQGT